MYVNIPNLGSCSPDGFAAVLLSEPDDLSYMMDNVAQLLAHGHYAFVDELLNIMPDSTSDKLLVGLATITFSWCHHLFQREAFLTRLDLKFCREYDSDRARNILKGLWRADREKSTDEILAHALNIIAPRHNTPPTKS